MDNRKISDKAKGAQAVRMLKITAIANGILDKAERKAILALVADYERLMRLQY